MYATVKRHACALVLAGLAAPAAFAPQPAAAQAEPFIGQLMAVGYNFCPRGWSNADGQLLPISQNSALFSLLGTTYGGDGRTTFGLPDLRGRAPIHVGSGPGLAPYNLGQKGGSESFTLTPNEMPAHSHAATTTSTLNAASAGGNQNAPAGHVLADDGNDRIYSDQAPDVAMAAGAVQSTTTVANSGGSQPVAKRSPYLVMRWCIALQGIYPSRN